MKKLAVIAVVIDDNNTDVPDRVNAILHEYRECVIGRMGIPHRSRSVALMSVMVEAPEDTVNSLSGKLGHIPGVSVKTAYSNYCFED